MSAAQAVLAALEAAGGVVEIACPGCKALVDLGEALASTLLRESSTEAQQVANAEAYIFAADAAAHAALNAAHVHVSPSPTVATVAAAATAALNAGTVPSWK